MQIDRGLKIINANSKMHHMTDKYYLQCGLLIVILGRVYTLIDNKSIHKNGLGN